MPIELVPLCNAHITLRAPIALPDTFAGYTRSYDPTAMGIETGMRTTMSARSKWTRLMKSAAIGTYQPAGSTAEDIVVLVVPSSVGAATADDLTRSMLSLSDPNAGYEQIGKHGGSSRCATMTTNGRTVPVCAWRDSQTTGVLMSLGTALGTSDFTPHQLNSIELAFRDAVD